ncbi:hypothetical protein C8R47DRAFT_1081605 [Mycena vitilis]|nr:hypothetical protein C8R47DRAFT_1081605 [Mycena vitilis]
MPPIIDEAYLAQLMESARAQGAQRRQVRSVPASLAAWWPVCGQESLAVADGHLSVEIAPIKRYLGKAMFLQESQAIIDNHADILFNAAGDYDEENAEKIGKIDFHIVQQSRMSSQGLDKFEEMEGESRELAQIFEAFFDEEGEPTKMSCRKLLVVRVLPPCHPTTEVARIWYRSPRIGRPDRPFAEFEMDSILLSPVGLNREEEYDRTVAKDKLTQYFGKLGFKMWHDKPNTDLPFMGTWTGYIRPSIENVIVVDAAAMFSTYTIDFVVVCGLTLLRWSCQNPMVQIHCFFMPMRGFNIEKERAINTVKLNRGKIP